MNIVLVILAVLLGIAFIPWMFIFIPAFVDMYLRSH